MMDPWLWLGLFILLAYTMEAATGFGSIIIALSLGALLLPIPALLPVLVPLNIFMSGYFSLRYHAHIHWPTLLRRVLPFMVVGAGLGYGLKPVLGNVLLQTLFGILILGFAGRELWQLSHPLRAAPMRSAVRTRFLLLGAGITHGLFASGGPLLVLALANGRLNKAALRSTLIAVWFSLNSLLTVTYLIDGSLIPALPRTLGYLPVILCGVVIGEWLHHRIDEQRFRQLIFLLLAVVGAMLVLAA